jgi:hypothetical protein
VATIVASGKTESSEETNDETKSRILPSCFFCKTSGRLAGSAALIRQSSPRHSTIADRPSPTAIVIVVTHTPHIQPGYQLPGDLR